MTIQNLIDLAKQMYAPITAVSDAFKVGYMNMAVKELSPHFGLVAEDRSLVTVADQDEYDYPTGIDDVSQIISIAIANSETPTSRYDYTRYYLSKGEDHPMQYNSFFQIMDESGNKKFVLYPAPALDDLPIAIRYNKKLAVLSTTVFTGSPEFDDRFHEMLAVYACYKAASEGPSPDAYQADHFKQEYDEMMVRLWKVKMLEGNKQNLKIKSAKHWNEHRSYGVGFEGV